MDNLLIRAGKGVLPDSLLQVVRWEALKPHKTQVLSKERVRGETWEIIDLEKLCNVISFWKHKWILDEWNIDNLIGNIFSMFYPLQALPTLSIFPMLQYFTKSGLINSTLISFINIFLISRKQIAYQLWRLLFTCSIFSVSCSGSAFSEQDISMLNLDSADHKQYCHLIDTLTALLGLM